jgi:type IV pilus assembly protein PilW
MKRNQSGVTLIELLISVAIGLVLAAVASYIYVSIQATTRNLEAQSQRNEVANFVFDQIGREIKLIGYYPSHYPKSATNVNNRGVFDKPFATTLRAFSQGVYGCSSASFNTTTGDCNPSVAGQPDSLLINYYADDTFPRPGMGIRRNCQNNGVEEAEFNGVKYNRVLSGNQATPVFTSTTTLAAPILVQNIYSLSNTQTATYYTDQQISTRSLTCWGNQAVGTPGAAFQPFVQGVDQMVVRYGIFNPTANYSPASYLSAAEVTNLAPVVVGLRSGDITYTGWQRVSTIRVCILTKTLDPNARQQINQGNYIDCNGTVVATTAADRAIYKAETRVFNVRNAIPTTLGS